MASPQDISRAAHMVHVFMHLRSLALASCSIALLESRFEKKHGAVSSDVWLPYTFYAFNVFPTKKTVCEFVYLCIFFVQNLVVWSNVHKGISCIKFLPSLH